MKVPESVRHPAEEASDEGRAAWVDFAEEQVEELRPVSKQKRGNIGVK